jgi:hypothetical protein
VDQQPTLSARRDTHVSADEEGETAEHLPLGRGASADQQPDPISKLLVVRHAVTIRLGSDTNPLVSTAGPS